MEDLLFRTGKSLALFVVMYLSLLFLGFPNGAAIVVSLIPLVLGTLNVMVATAYGIAALFFVAAAVSSLLPPKYGGAVGLVQQVLKDVSFDRGPGSSAPDKGKSNEAIVKPKD